MNQNWNNFLISEQARFTAAGDIVFPDTNRSGDNTLHPIAHLAVLTVTGHDAANFLQGQITCDITTVSESQGSMGAYCNAKGRTLCTFFIIKNRDAFLLILPSALLEQTKKKLQMFIMRADVQLTDDNEQYCLFGLQCSHPEATDLSLPEQIFSKTDNNGVQWLRVPSKPFRFIAIADSKNASECWSELTRNNHFHPASSIAWRYQDMLAGIPWLTAETTELYIPQMLNLDQLQGISFKKGCYVGQEIIARTHYLGKAKRSMYLAECGHPEPIAAGTEIVTDDPSESQSIGKILSSLVYADHTTLLAVLQTHATEKNLRLSTPNQDRITLTKLSYLTKP